MGRPGASEEEIEEAVGIAQMADYVVTCPTGWSICSSSPARISPAGRSGCICIARAILKNAPIFIFDDSFFRSRLHD